MTPDEAPPRLYLLFNELDERRTKGPTSMNTAQCWFCEGDANSNSDGQPYNIQLRRGELDGAMKTVYTTSIDVPRCRSCQSTHQATDKARAPYGLIYKALMSLAVICGGAALMTDDARFFLAAGIVVALMACVFVAGSARPAAPQARALEYPPVAERLRTGWRQDFRFGPG
ncbi:hypothetical protein ABZV91_32335 [Nocardia sp. NPDC004568]|uniref:hypothetical protein n=1 Tax=Nocardia sp. NPDC004568 TaxID=3154551 RepID=UPI0033A0E31C